MTDRNLLATRLACAGLIAAWIAGLVIALVGSVFASGGHGRTESLAAHEFVVALPFMGAAVLAIAALLLLVLKRGGALVPGALLLAAGAAPFGVFAIGDSLAKEILGGVAVGMSAALPATLFLVSGAVALAAKGPATAEEAERAKALPSLIAHGFALLGVLACGVVGVLLAAVDLVLQSSAGSWVGLVLGSAIGLGCTVLSLRSPRASGVVGIMYGVAAAIPILFALASDHGLGPVLVGLAAMCSGGFVVAAVFKMIAPIAAPPMEDWERTT